MWREAHLKSLSFKGTPWRANICLYAIHCHSHSSLHTELNIMSSSPLRCIADNKHVFGTPSVNDNRCARFLVYLPNQQIGVHGSPFIETNVPRLWYLPCNIPLNHMAHTISSISTEGDVQYCTPVEYGMQERPPYPGNVLHWQTKGTKFKE